MASLRGGDVDKIAVYPEHDTEGRVHVLTEQVPGHPHPAAEDPQPGSAGG